MAAKVDMALDDIIKAKKAIRGKAGRGAARGGNRGRGTFKPQTRGTFKARGTFKPRGALRGSVRGVASRARGISRGTFRGVPSGRGMRGQARGIVRRTVPTQRFSQVATPQGPSKITITNLEYGVSDSDVKELFQEFGDMKSAAIHYDSKGQSLGTAHVVFTRYSDALKAVKQYNGVLLDGRPMKITIDNQQRIQTAVAVAAKQGAFKKMTVQQPVKRLSGPLRGAPRGRGGMRGNFRGAGGRGNFRGQGTRGSFRGNTRGGRGGARGAGRGRGRGRGAARKAPNVADLDAELDAYANQSSK